MVRRLAQRKCDGPLKAVVMQLDAVMVRRPSWSQPLQGGHLSSLQSSVSTSCRSRRCSRCGSKYRWLTRQRCRSEVLALRRLSRPQLKQSILQRHSLQGLHRPVQILKLKEIASISPAAFNVVFGTRVARAASSKQGFTPCAWESMLRGPCRQRQSSQPCGHSIPA